MNEPQSAASPEGSSSAPLQLIATAPGDLPLNTLQRKAAIREHQFRHDNTIAPQSPQVNQAVEVLAHSGTGMPLASATVYYTSDGSLPDQRSPSVAMRVDHTIWEPLGGFLRVWSAWLPGQAAGTVVRYRIGGRQEGTGQGGERMIWAHDGQGFWFQFDGDLGITTFAYRVEQQTPTMPDWIREGVLYQVFLDRFHPGSADGAFSGKAAPTALHGGTLRGVKQALPYLADLGITVLWLSPLWPAESYHRYDILDLFSVDPKLGTEQDLRDLIGGAHAQGIKVLLDFVPSHASWHHPGFLAAQRDRGAESFRWFTFYQWPDRYRMFLDIARQMPSWNLDDPSARAHVIGAALYWMREFGVDGYRLDHAIAPSMDFWVAYREATQAVNPHCFSVGEATDSPDALRRYRGRLDAVLDFKLAGALRLTFGTADWPLSTFDAFLHAYDDYMESGPGRVSFLDNHDMNRFLWVAGGSTARLKIAALCMFTLTPPPTIYYGTEVGIRQPHDISDRALGGDAAARTDMPWNPAVWDHELRQFFRSLIRLRRAQPVLRGGRRRTVWCDDRTHTLAYRCEGLDDRDHVLAVFNLSSEPQVIPVSTESESSYECRLASGDAPVASLQDGRVLLTVPPVSAALLSLGRTPAES